MSEPDLPITKREALLMLQMIQLLTESSRGGTANE